MILKFFYQAGKDGADPLVASAYIAGDGNQGPPWTPGRLEFYDIDLLSLPGDVEDWEHCRERLRRFLLVELNAPIVVRNRPSLKPWTRLAFENIHKYGHRHLYGLAYAKLFEDDGRSFDPANAIPLYPPNYRSPSPLTYRRPGMSAAELAREDRMDAEYDAILKHKWVIREKFPEMRALYVRMAKEYLLAHTQSDEVRLAEVRTWFQQLTVVTGVPWLAG